jgi:tRNA dimethylallyltransferase
MHSSSLPPHRPLISIVGPTATGKSKCALTIAEKMLVEGYFSTVAIISADSRQVYQGLEIVSGADIPADYELAVVEIDHSYPHFVKKTIYGEVQLHGLSMIAPTVSWSLADFQKFALKVINETWRHGGLPLVVGGTGLYHQRLFAEELAELPGPNSQLREQVSTLSLAELQQQVLTTFPSIYSSMTIDDQHNRRRLIRVLEKGDSESTERLSPQPSTAANGAASAATSITQPSWHCTLGLTDTIEHIEPRITLRVDERLKQ